MEKYIMPCRIVLAENTESVERLLEEKPLQTNFTSDDCTVIKKGGFVLVDFGKELCGGIIAAVQKTSNFPDCGKCRIVFGESVMESLSTLGYKNATNNHSVRDTIVEVSSMSTFRYGNTGFRFVKLEAVDSDIFVKSLKAETDIKELEYKGSFECNDELINEIWKTGAYTVHLNMHEFVWDGVKRDRLVWIGDMHSEVATINAVFGNDESVPQSLDFIKNETPSEKWMNGIATYSMWWVIIHHDWYMHWGNIEYLYEQKAYLKKLTEHAIKWIDDGFDGRASERFVDWSSKETSCEIEGVKAVFCMGLDCAARLFDILGEEAYAQKAEAYAQGLRAMKVEERLNKRIAALTLLSGRPSDDAREMLEGNSAKDMSCFLGYYVLLAKARLGDFNDALDIIREYWGGMIKLGATTFWEDFDVEWIKNSAGIDVVTPAGMKDIHGDFGRYCYKQFRHSLCHGWASGPTAFLSQRVLGIEILEPGCRMVRINPNLGDLKWVKGTYPTLYGNITIEHKKVNGKVDTKVMAPEEIEIVF
ncbi:MAG: alpha-L-rhamnosidase [Clostridia bacterium]|nr:alpha-L-rhamnosidase [Clostridia bacterium]MBP3360080.1 alpha-L-rhamnosidase [Clostridia bacterium]